MDKETLKVNGALAKLGRTSKRDVSRTGIADQTKEDESLIDELRPKEDGVKNFQIMNNRLLLTYRTWIDKKTYIEAITEKLNFAPKFVRLAHETGDKVNPYKHSHVLFDFGTKFKTRDCRYFDWVVDGEIIHPNIYVVHTMKHWKRCLNYLAKEDVENSDLKEEPNLFLGVTECKNVQEALEKYVKGPSDANGIVTMYQMKPRPEMKCKIHRSRRWQKQLIERISTPIVDSDTDDEDGDTGDAFEPYTAERIKELWNTPHRFKSGLDRKVIIVRDVPGCKGKTWVGLELSTWDPTQYLMIQGLSTASNVATVVDNAVARGWNGHCVFINFTREQTDHKIFSSLEMIRDGAITTFKYNGHSFRIMVNHTVLLMNEWIDIRKMSHDRAECYDIRDDNGFWERIPFDDVVNDWIKRHPAPEETAMSGPCGF